MEKKRIFNNCSIEDMEQLEGYTIDSVIAPSDASGEGFTMDCHRMIENVEVGRSFYVEDGECYISEEYINGIR